MNEFSAARKVAILIYDQVEILDFTGPYEAFIVGSNMGRDFYVYTVAEKEEPVRALGGLNVLPDYSIHTCPPPHILIVPGGWGVRSLLQHETLIPWIQQTAAQAEHVLSICSGALLLAAAQLLDNCLVTTHHHVIPDLMGMVPESCALVENVRFVDNGHLLMSAGVSAGIDLSLYVIGKLYGDDRRKEAASLMEYPYGSAHIPSS